MAKKAYIGVNGVARKINKMYIGDASNIARRIKKAYIGVGGVARPFFSGEPVEYWGTATALSTARSNLASTTVGDYALFAGGLSVSSSSAVDVYNTSLTYSTATALSTARSSLASTTVGDYALFAGGYGSSLSDDVDTYNKSLTHSTTTSLSTARRDPAAATVGDYALFAGGDNNGGTIKFDVVDVYMVSQ